MDHSQQKLLAEHILAQVIVHGLALVVFRSFGAYSGNTDDFYRYHFTIFLLVVILVTTVQLSREYNPGMDRKDGGSVGGDLPDLLGSKPKYIYF